MRLAGGERLASGAERGELTWWVRFREAVSAPPAVALLALGDALPPAAFCQLPAIGPVSSTSWLLHMLALEPETGGRLVAAAVGGEPDRRRLLRPDYDHLEHGRAAGGHGWAGRSCLRLMARQTAIAVYG